MIPNSTQNKWKRALFFTLSLVPIALVGGFFINLQPSIFSIAQRKSFVAN